MSGRQDIGPVDNWNDFLVKSKKEFLEYYNRPVKSDLTIKQFEILTTIGKGSYGTVIMAKKIDTNEIHAIKVIDKALIVQINNVEQTLSEKKILQAVKFPFIISLDYYFKDNTYLYFAMPFIVGGEMFSVLRKAGKFDERKSIFYAAQVVLAFEYLHYQEVVYRDLKPENILFDATGYLKLTDLGFAKVVQKRTYTLCGTPDYLAPEVLLNKGYSFPVDWWGLGVLIYEMCCGVPPFYAKDISQTYEFIVNRIYKCPYHFSEQLHNIVDNFLQIDVSRRLGCMKAGVEEIKSHGWFRGVVWLDILNKKVRAPYIPSARSKADTSNFDAYEEWEWTDDAEDKFKNVFIDFL